MKNRKIETNTSGELIIKINEKKFDEGMKSVLTCLKYIGNEIYADKLSEFSKNKFISLEAALILLGYFEMYYGSETDDDFIGPILINLMVDLYGLPFHKASIKAFEEAQKQLELLSIIEENFIFYVVENEVAIAFKSQEVA